MATPVRLQAGELIDWSPRVALRMIVSGVALDGERVPIRRVLAHIADVTRAWWRWTMALPGDRFVDFPRNLVIQVDGGTPARRTVRVLTREAEHYAAVRSAGLDAVFALTPSEPSTYRWVDLWPWKAR